MGLSRVNIVMLLIAVTYVLAGIYSEKNWQQSRQGGDGLGYYIYLPSILIYQDLGSYEKTSNALRKYAPQNADLSTDIYGFRPSPLGKLANKYPVGVAILQMPFFSMAHMYAKITGHYDADGFSRPYQVFCYFSTMFYVLIGLWFLQKVLVKYYSNIVTILTIVLIALGTNLFFFGTVFTGMAHGYQFFAVSMFIYFSDKCYPKINLKHGILMGLSLGLVGIIRPQDLVVGLIPLFWGVASLTELKEKIRSIASNISVYLAAVIAFLLVIGIQLIYYKYISGQWLYYSYVGETFNWAKPEIYKGFFHAQNGWFLYTPLMLLVVASIFIKTHQRKLWVVAVVSVLVLHAYVSYSWWCWFYIAGMGSRPMVDIYPLLAFALAGLLAWLFAKPKVIGIPIFLLLIFLGTQNLRFTYQQFHGYIFSEANNLAYYKAMFFKTKPDKQDIITFNTQDVQPNESNFVIQDTLYQSDFENIKNHTDSILVKSGKYSINMEAENIDITMMDLKSFDLKKGDWLRVRLDAHIDKDGFWFVNLPKFILEFKEYESSRTIWNSACPTALIGNVDNSIWCTGIPKRWERITYFTKVPIIPNESSTLRIIGFNPNKIKWNMDNLLIEVCKKEAHEK